MLSVGSASHFMADLARMNFKTRSGFGGDIMVSVFFFVYYYPAFYLYAGPRNRLFFHKFFFNPHVLIQTGRISSVEYFNRNIFLFFTPFYSFPGKKAVRYKKRACAALPLRRYDVCLCGHAVPACPFSSFIRAARVQRSVFHRSPVFLPSFSGI